MPTATPAFEDYSITMRSGDARISRLVLSGWQTAASTLRTWSDRGRMWGKISPTSGDGYFQLYRRPSLASGDLLAHGTLSSTTNTATLTAQNSSGISGSVEVLQHTETDTHIFDVVVSYADEQDIVTIYQGATNELDSNSKYAGLDTRFEALLKEQKRYLDQLVWARLGDEIGVDNLGRPNLGYIADPRQLARVHALLCVSQLYERRGALDMLFAEGAKRVRAQAQQEFNAIRLLMDSDRDQTADGYAKGGSIPVYRA